MQLSKQNRDRLLLLSTLPIVASVALWWSFINQSNKALAKSRPQIAELNANIAEANWCLKRWDQAWTNDYARALAKLAVKEKDMLPKGREPSSFLDQAIERVRTNHPAVRFESISPATFDNRLHEIPELINPAAANLPLEWVFRGRVVSLPQFPYHKNASVGYMCRGPYRDFVAFLADLEKTYPYMQFQLNALAKLEQQKEGEDDRRFELKVLALLPWSSPSFLAPF